VFLQTSVTVLDIKWLKKLQKGGKTAILNEICSFYGTARWVQHRNLKKYVEFDKVRFSSHLGSGSGIRRIRLGGNTRNRPNPDPKHYFSRRKSFKMWGCICYIWNWWPILTLSTHLSLSWWITTYVPSSEKAYGWDWSSISLKILNWRWC